MDRDTVKQRELYVIKQLKAGHSRKWVAAQLVEKYNIAEGTANNVVNSIGAELNKSLADLNEDAAQYIYNTLLSTIDETIEDKDKKSRLKALELLAKVCKVGQEENKTDINIRFDFDK